VERGSEDEGQRHRSNKKRKVGGKDRGKNLGGPKRVYTWGGLTITVDARNGIGGGKPNKDTGTKKEGTHPVLVTVN